jgi:hypothetical protein
MISVFAKFATTSETHNNAGNATLWVAVPLQLIRNCGKDARRKRHVKDSVLFFLVLLNLSKMLCEVNERLVLIVLTANIGAELAEAVQLFFNLLCRGLDV